MGYAMNMKPLLDIALVRFDQVGYQLDDFGIASNINRHQVIAYLMAEQKRLEGEVDSLRARIDFRRVQVERIVGSIEKTARNGLDLALWPARFTLSTLKGIAGQS